MVLEIGSRWRVAALTFPFPVSVSGSVALLLVVGAWALIRMRTGRSAVLAGSRCAPAFREVAAVNQVSWIVR